MRACQVTNPQQLMRNPLLSFKSKNSPHQIQYTYGVWPSGSLLASYEKPRLIFFFF